MFCAMDLKVVIRRTNYKLVGLVSCPILVVAAVIGLTILVYRISKRYRPMLMPFMPWFGADIAGLFNKTLVFMLTRFGHPGDFCRLSCQEL